ncbi:MAG: FtsX-like permease family protein, partial [Candidatus Kerfeldbacteria bacterium]|nr:FtsX-like permease family protein [Candidatus Kerfeldbacteria bacterium]
VTIFILFLTLLSITFSSSLNLVAREALTLVKSRADVSVYFLPTSLDEDIQKVQAALSAIPEVRKVTFISRDQALAAYKERNADNPVIQETIDVLGTNPLGATLVIQAKKIEDFPAILSVLDQPEYAKLIQSRDYEENKQVFVRLSTIAARLQQIGVGAGIVFSLIAVLVMFNTLRVTIYTYREEIGIMKLVGASNWFIRAPFVLESILYAILASIIVGIVMLPLIGTFAPIVNRFFTGYAFDLVRAFREHLVLFLGLQFGIGIIIAGVSSIFAIGRHLRT